MELEIDMDDLSARVKEHLFIKPDVWEDYLPIVETETSLSAYLYEGILVPSVYAELHNKLRNLPSHKTVDLYINNGGGYEHGASVICDAIKTCKSEVTAHLSGIVASAATMITMECDNITVAPDLMFMIHEASFDSMGGKFSDVKSFQDFYNDHTRNMSKRTYLGFLTKDEVERMHNGKELWFNAEEVLERWALRKEHLCQNA